RSFLLRLRAGGSGPTRGRPAANNGLEDKRLPWATQARGSAGGHLETLAAQSEQALAQGQRPGLAVAQVAVAQVRQFVGKDQPVVGGVQVPVGLDGRFV